MTWGSNSMHFVYDALGAAAVVYNGTTYYYLRNAMGDITGLVNTSGTQVVSYTYDAWGKLLSTTGTMASTLGNRNPLRYRGYFYDTETGLYYLMSRYYNPTWGRFINADIFISTGQGIVGCNMFAYCNNNPVSMVDSSGSFSLRTFNVIETGKGGIGCGVLIIASVSLFVAAERTVPVLKDAIEKINSLVTTVIDSIKSFNPFSSKENTRIKSETQEKPVKIPQAKRNYWAAELIEKQVVVTTPLTLAEACIRVSSGGSIMCKDQASAYVVVMLNGYTNYVGPEIHGGVGYYEHYHPTRNHKGYPSIHIWFYA